MKKILFPVLLTIFSVISVVIFHSPFTYFNLFMSIVFLGIVTFSRNKDGQSRIGLSALWMLILELMAFVLLLLGVNIYQPSLVWVMYAVFIVVEIFVTPRIDQQR